MAATGWRNAGYGLLTLGVLIALVVVPAVVSSALPDEGPPLAADVRVDIGYGASIQPPAGARHDLAESRPGSGEVRLILTDQVRLRLSAQQFRGDPGPYMAHARHKLDRDDGLRAAGRPESIRTTSGLTGEQGSLVPADVDGAPGCYALLTTDGIGVLALATPVASCAALPPAVTDAIASITIDTEGTS